MTTKRKTWLALLLATTLFIPSLVGCGGGEASSTTASTSSEANAMPSEQSTSAVNQPTVIADGIGTEPAQCVAIFLDSLRQGNQRAANNALTSKAREELAKTLYVIEPLGTPESEYKIGRVAYPYEEKNVALVECTWVDPPQAGQAPVTMDIVCEVHLEPEGWRLSGMGVSIAGTEERFVLDFEDGAALQSTVDQATGQTQPQQSQAALGQAVQTPTMSATGVGQADAGQFQGVQYPNAEYPSFSENNQAQQYAPSQQQASQQMPELPSFPSQQTAPNQTATQPQYGDPLRR